MADGYLVDGFHLSPRGGGGVHPAVRPGRGRHLPRPRGRPMTAARPNAAARPLARAAGTRPRRARRARAAAGAGGGAVRGGGGAAGPRRAGGRGGDVAARVARPGVLPPAAATGEGRPVEKEQGHARPLVVVVLGGSRPQMGLQPGPPRPRHRPDRPLVFNCAQSGCLPVGVRLNLARLLATGVTPECVLIEVLPPVLADPGPRGTAPPGGAARARRPRPPQPYFADPDAARRDWARGAGGVVAHAAAAAAGELGRRRPVPARPQPPGLPVGRDAASSGGRRSTRAEWTAGQRAAGLATARGTTAGSSTTSASSR